MPIIDVFRFIAASLVLLVHYKYIFGIEIIWEAFAASALSWFFVVSGFILSYRYPQLHRTDLKKFYLFRLVRIYPLYLLAVLFGSLVTAMGYSRLHEDFFIMVGRSPMGTYDLPMPINATLWSEALIKHLFFIQILSNTETLKFLLNPPLWSISNEAFFYLCFPLLLRAIRHLTRISHIIITLMLIYGLQHLLVQIFLPTAKPLDWYNLNTLIYTNPLIRIMEFIMGMLLYQAYCRSQITLGRLIFYPILLLLIMLYIGVMYVNLSIPMQYGLFLTGLPVIILIVYVLAQVNWQPQGSLRKLCIFSGGASYVLYSLHWPLMEMSRFFDFNPNDSVPWFFHFTGLYLLIVLLSFAIHLWIEIPLRAFLLHRCGHVTHRSRPQH